MLFSACISKNSNKIIASVGDKQLMLSDLISAIPENIDDSKQRVAVYLHNIKCTKPLYL